ncbi:MULTISPECIES: S-adenosylmethionine synthetase N-terminal domain-containing protein [unclassified Catenibacterium]|uniref:S-adenosylmethionine synthetase N-terminal domain-containing protein n=1 Tax=unclassified Catenibacterium TaxID=2643636 RepID=UPI001F30071A|nr:MULTISPECIES: S-adenosylmethionine synthetase N-terminal domain-containing protein [unclassified Catenibacterium]
MCDFISDSVLDMASSNDELSKKAVERSIKDNKIWIFGEAKTKARLNYTEIVNTALKINNIK